MISETTAVVQVFIIVLLIILSGGLFLYTRHLRDLIQDHEKDYHCLLTSPVHTSKSTKESGY